MTSSPAVARDRRLDLIRQAAERRRGPAILPLVAGRERPKPSPVSTAAQELLTAARCLRQPFTMEELVIEAWKQNPERWGLLGFAHPDSNRVSAAFFGARGLTGKGLVERVGKRYQLTTKGWAEKS